jgi:hypothetical protein
MHRRGLLSNYHAKTFTRKKNLSGILIELLFIHNLSIEIINNILKCIKGAL